jgi:HD domain-containing protein
VRVSCSTTTPGASSCSGCSRPARLGLSPDYELLYVAAVFHDLGLTPRYRSPDRRFEIDGAEQARDFLTAHGVAETDVRLVWNAIALHTTPAIPAYMEPETGLVTAGVELDVLGLGHDQLSTQDREEMLAAHPRHASRHRSFRGLRNPSPTSHKPPLETSTPTCSIVAYPASSDPTLSR